jgi:glycosyltransferase involved in cell wall biosynthesis
MTTDILISIVIPVFNVEDSLSRCLDSILNQTFKNFEIIIVNDASTDNTQQVIDRYKATFPNHIQSIIKENGGPGEARNFGMKKAVGKYLTFADGDDTLEPNYFDVIINAIEKHQPDLVFIAYQRIYNRKQSLLEKIYPFGSWNIYDTPVSLSSHPEIICKTEGAPWLRIIKREIIAENEKLLFSNGKMAEDQEASLRWFLHTPKIVFCKEPIYNYVIHSKSLNFTIHSISDFMKVIDSVCGHYQSEGKLQTYYSELEIVFIKQLLISNMRRLKMAKADNKFETFMGLREGLSKYFPEYYNNRYLKNEPIYVRLAVYLSWKTPRIFKYIL